MSYSRLQHNGERRRWECWFIRAPQMVSIEHVFPRPTAQQLQPIFWQLDNFLCCYSSASNRIIHAKDHASVQLSIVVVDPETGRQTDGTKTYAICGEIRRMGESDDCIVRLAKKDGLITK